MKKKRVTEALAIIGTEAARTFAASDIANLTSAFENSINDSTTP